MLGLSKKNSPKGKQICNSLVIKLRNGLPTIPSVGGVTAVLCSELSAHLPVRAFTFALHESNDIRRAWTREREKIFIIFSITMCGQRSRGVTVYPIFRIKWDGKPNRGLSLELIPFRNR